jgi:predicted Rossmann fold flavoprotein
MAEWDVIVVGAGAAGLLAAARAAERGRRTLLLEKGRKPGVKILMSGGTRCNITHATDNRGIVEAYGKPGRFLHSALAALSVADTVALFESLGVPTKVEETGKIFPVSNKATDVLAALLRLLQQSGATLALSEPLLSWRHTGTAFELTTPQRTLHTEKVILTTGGQSYPGCGTTGDGYRLARDFGHTVVTPRPALVPLVVNVPWVQELRGVTLPDVLLKVVETGKTLASRRSSLLFAHFGLTGPAALDVSRVVSGHSQPSSLMLEIDLLPGLSDPDLAEYLKTEALASGKKQLVSVLAAHLPRRLCEVMLNRSRLDVERRAAGLTRGERTHLVTWCKRLLLPVAGTLGFGKAEVTAGGVALDEVDSRTMQSKLRPGLYLAGEVLDLDGPIGGYNFQAAWSTGWLAGSCV